MAQAARVARRAALLTGPWHRACSAWYSTLPAIFSRGNQQSRKLGGPPDDGIRDFQEELRAVFGAQLADVPEGITPLATSGDRPSDGGLGEPVPPDSLSHVDASGKAVMVDVSGKAETTRVAVASGKVLLGAKAFSLVAANQIKKGDVLAVAKIAGICGAKQTSVLIPLCHNIMLSGVDVTLTLDDKSNSVDVRAEARAVGTTGVEMEALTAVSVASLTVYDMCKAVSKDIRLTGIQLESKTGGKSGMGQQEVIIAMGGNMGDRVENFRKALQLMRLAGLRISDHACLYESAPAYVTEQPPFLNSAVRVYTRLQPEELLAVLKNIEKDVGRVSGGTRFGPRPIDLDIIFYGNSTVSTENLQIPHCRFSERPFVLAPVVDLLGPELDVPGHWSTHPSTKGGIFRLWQAMGGESLVGKDGLRRVMPVRGKLMDWWQKTHVMGILNVTPDSFSDGGKYNCVEEAVSHARAMALEGADIIDVGAQSTRPNATRLSSEEELARLLPVLEEVKKVRELEGVLISVDTFDATVAEAAVGLGADIVNDVSGGCLDSRMYETVGSLGVPYILMHMRGDPQSMQSGANLSYDDANLCKEIGEEVCARLKDAQAAGIPAWSIITDPGIGFAKNQWQDLEILRNLGSFRRELCGATRAFFHAPVAIGPSRKKFLGHVTGREKAEDRDAATIGAVSVGVMNGANIVRAHNVAAVRDAIKVVDAIFSGSTKDAVDKGHSERQKYCAL